MTDDLHSDIREILLKTTRIETALWPDENQPGVLSKHDTRMNEIDERVDGLVNWRNYLTGAWSVLAALFGIHWVGGGKH
jgi:hypothetical protein